MQCAGKHQLVEFISVDQLELYILLLHVRSCAATVAK